MNTHMHVYIYIYTYILYNMRFRDAAEELREVDHDRPILYYNII